MTARSSAVVRVKICGLTHRDDALHAVECGADALGFVFAPRSRRRAEPAAVARIVAEVPRGVATVGVFQDQPLAVVREIVLGCGLDVAQLHGAEDSAYVRDLALPVLKAVGMLAPDDVARLADYPGLGVFLLDAAHVEFAAGGGLIRTGGTGTPFDWSWATTARRCGRIVLSGGLRPDNVADAVRVARPWAVDVATGTESGPGRKDPALVREFVRRARRAGEEMEPAETPSDAETPSPDLTPSEAAATAWGDLWRDEPDRPRPRPGGSAGARGGRIGC